MLRLLNNIIFFVAIISISNVYALEKNDLNLSQSSRFTVKSKVADSEGDFSSAEYSLYAKKEYFLMDRFPVSTRLGLRHIQIRNTSTLDLPSSIQTKNIYARFLMPMSFVDDQKLFLGIDLSPGYSTASGHGFESDTFRFNSGVSIVYRKENNLTIVLGTMFRSEYDISVIPFVGFKYTVNNRIDLNFLSLNPNISYKLNDKFRILLECNILSDEFEIIKGNRKSQILSVYGLDAGIGFEYCMSDDLISKLSLGGSFDRKFKYIDDRNDGDKLEPKDSLYIGYELKKKF